MASSRLLPRFVLPLVRVAVVGLPLVALAGCGVFFQQHAVGNTHVPAPAKPVSIQAYLGRWYEIARYEQSFQKGCEGVTADYSLKPSGKLSIVNTCREPDGRIRQAKALAYVIPDTGNTQLKVSFFGPFYIGNYWILDHAEDYAWAIVGDPSGRYLWILARKPVLPSAEVDALIARVQALGYDTSTLLRTQQP